MSEQTVTGQSNSTPRYCKCAFTDADGTTAPGDPCPIHPSKEPIRKWRAQGCGGHSVVLSEDEPVRNDTRIPAYGYKGELGYSVGYPFIDDEGKDRYDFVCFSHTDARLIAAAPELLEACRRIIAAPHGVALADLQYLTDAVAKVAGDGYACTNCTARFVSVETRDRHLGACHD